MTLLRSKKSFVALLAMVTIILSMQVMPVAAYFFGYDTPPYGASGTHQPVNFHTVEADATDGECEIQVDPLIWPLWYVEDTESIAWVAGVYEMGQTVTQTWYFIANWDIDYRLNCGWLGKVTISIVFRVYDADNELLQERTVWSVSHQGPRYSWDDIEWDLDNEADFESFTEDLTNGHTYKFAVGLKIHIDNNSGAIDVNARNDHSEPALLEVNSICWSLYPPE